MTETGTSAGGRAFVICQIGEKGSPERKRADEVLEHVIEPVCRDKGLAVARSDRDPTPGQITSQILRSVINADVVIADVTGRNPNVYFELGVAQSFAKRIVMIVKDVGQLPFDVKNERVIVIGDGDVLGVSEAKEASRDLAKALDVVLSDGYEPSNLVVEVASARSLDALAPDNPMASQMSAMREMLEEQNNMLRLSLRRTTGRPQSVDADTTVLREFVEEMVERNIPTRSRIRHLTTGDTSRRHDQWVERTLDRLIEVENAAANEQDEEEEPF